MLLSSLPHSCPTSLSYKVVFVALGCFLNWAVSSTAVVYHTSTLHVLLIEIISPDWELPANWHTWHVALLLRRRRRRRRRRLLLLLLLLKCQHYSTAITQLRGHFTKSISKTVAQLNADVCWRSEWTTPRQPYEWRKRWDLDSLQNVKSEEQTRVPGSRLFHAQKGAVTKGSPTSWRYLQCRGVSVSKKQ